MPGMASTDYDDADAEVEFAAAGFAAAVEHAGDAETEKAAERSAREGLPALLEELFHYVRPDLIRR